MFADEPTSEEYKEIATQTDSLVKYANGAVKRAITYARRMYSSMSEVDNDYLANALDSLSRTLVAVGEDAECVHLHALRCQTEAELREQEDQQEDEEADGERPE